MTTVVREVNGHQSPSSGIKTKYTRDKKDIIGEKRNEYDRNKRKYLYSSIFSILICLICVIVFQYYQKNINLKLSSLTNSFNDQRSTNIKKGKIVPEKKNLKSTINKNEFDPEAMIRFTNFILNSTLEGFPTVEKLPVKIDEISKFNNIHFAPRILSIIKLDPFKFVKFNLKRPCTLWEDSFSCTKMKCNIKFCDKSQLPKAYLDLDNSIEEGCPTDSPKELSKLDQTLKQSNVKELNKLFECSRDDSEDSQYYDLLINPERYTGYDGRQIWKAIYEENCFSMKNINIFSLLQDGCYEERIFYRIISGLHTSITIHLTAIDHKFKDNFGPNPKEYFKRFYDREDYFKNLFFTYLIELHALYKSQYYILNKIKWNSIEDKVQAKDAIKALLSTETLFKWHFDDQVLFKHTRIAEQLGYTFNNITFKIMDCVACDKCRLWGKVQTNGLGTAFKIMLTDNLENLKLSHHEITCLLNALARLSFSITQISDFKNIYLLNDYQPNNNKRIQSNVNDKTNNFVSYFEK